MWIVNEFRRKWSDSINVKNKQFYQDDIPSIPCLTNGNPNNAISDGSSNKENRFRHFQLSNVIPCQKHNCAKSSTKTHATASSDYFLLFTDVLFEKFFFRFGFSFNFDFRFWFPFQFHSLQHLSIITQRIKHSISEMDCIFLRSFVQLRLSNFFSNEYAWLCIMCMLRISARPKWAQIRARPPKRESKPFYEYCIDFYYFSFLFRRFIQFVLFFFSATRRKLLELSILTSIFFCIH